MFTPNRSYQASGGSSKSRRRASGVNSFGGTPKSSLQSSKYGLRRCSIVQGRSGRVSFGTGSAANSPTLNMTMNLQTGSHTVTSFGSSLPVKIMEALSEVDENEMISVEINENGWAWLIYKRKLLVWKYKPGKSKVIICKEFTLPKSDSAISQHSSKLIYVSSDAEHSDEVSLLVTTPEGEAIYWPSIIINTEFKLSVVLDASFAASSVETKLIKLVALKNNAAFAALSNQGYIYLIYANRSSIQFVKVQQSSGMLAGIGRRMSSFFYTPSVASEALDIVVMNPSTRNFSHVIVLTKTHLQKWKLSNTQDGVNECIAHSEFSATTTDDLCLGIWNSLQSNFRYWPLQIAMCSHSNDFVVLFAASNSSQTQNTPVQFALCLCSQSVFQNCRVTDTYPLDHLQLVNNEQDDLNYNLIIPNDNRKKSGYAVVANKNIVIVKELNENPGDKIPFESSGDSVIGIGKFNNECVMLSALNSLLVLKQNELDDSQITLPNSFLLSSTLNSPQQGLSLNDSNISNAEMPSMVRGDLDSLASNADFTHRLKAAFIYYNKKDIEQSKEIVESTFSNDFDHTLDKAVVALSQNLIDDHPVQDPRWAETLPEVSTGSSNSLLLHHQLKDKAQAHELFVKFLTDVDIMSKLTTLSTSVRMASTSTKWLLLEHGEKLAAANALRLQHSKYPSVVDVCIKSVMRVRMDVLDNTGLTPRDLFYREISRIDEIIPALIDTEEQIIQNSLLSSKDVVMHILSVNDILQGMLSAASEYRRSRRQPVITVDDRQYEYLPWTVQARSHNVRDLIVRQHKIIIEKGITEAQDAQERAAFHTFLVVLADIVLTGYNEQLESVQNCVDLRKRVNEINKDFDLAKKLLISPLINLSLHEKAAYLGEKYRDYGILVALCEKTQDQKTLIEYINKFGDDGFCDFLFNWFFENGKIKSLLQLAKNGAFSQSTNSAKLTEYLSHHPDISWFHQIETDKFSDAQVTLQLLAKDERENALKKKQFLGLSKMACLFSDDTDDLIEEKVAQLDTETVILEYQETLPDVVLKNSNYDSESMPVLEIPELVNLYIGEKNINSNEIDFKKALELLQYIPEEYEEMGSEVRDLKVLIWCQCILKNAWSGIDSSAHITHACSHTVLFKLLQLLYENDTVADSIPDVEEILDHNILGNLRQSSSFQYIIRALFEEFNRTVENVMR